MQGLAVATRLFSFALPHTAFLSAFPLETGLSRDYFSSPHQIFAAQEVVSSGIARTRAGNDTPSYFRECIAYHVVISITQAKPSEF